MARNSKNKIKQVSSASIEIIKTQEEEEPKVIETPVKEEKKEELKLEAKVITTPQISHNIMIGSNGGFGDKLVRNFI